MARRGRSIVGFAAALGGVALFAWAAWALLSGFVGALAQSRAWVKQPEFTETTRTAEDLFNAAFRAGVIWFEPEGPRLAMQPCEALHRADLAAARPQGFGPDGRRVLDKLCNLAAGRQIMAELQVWNTSFTLAGVRDDRSGTDECADGREADGAVIQPGCRPALWSARAVTPALAGDVPLNAQPGAAPPPRDFADFAVGTSRAMSDWALFGPLTGESDSLRLTSTMPARARRLTVDLILEPTRISIGRDAAAVDLRRDELNLRLGPFAVAAERLCPEDSPGDTCAQAIAAGAPGGWRLVITGPARAAETPILIEGRPLRATPVAAQAVLRPGPRPEDGRVRLWRSAHVEVTCTRARADLRCEADWREPVRRQRGSGGGGAIVFSDGQPAIDTEGYPSALVDQLGLTALLGYGPGDLGSLAGSVGTLRSRETTRLTIDPALQRIALDAVTDHMQARLGRGQRPRRPGPLQDSTIEREPQDVGDGRAALVLMDAGDEPGAILAMAGWPLFRAGMNAWDLQALAAGRATESPLAGHAWRSGDVHAMPGSTFKLVTGLAGVMALGERPDMADILSGRMAPAEQQRALGVGGAELFVDGTGIRNFGGAGFASAVLPPGRGASGCPPARGGGQIGVCEALIKSSNLWFGGVALGIDSRRVGRPGTQAERTGTWLARATEHYFPIAEPGASPARQAQINRNLDLARGLAPGALRLIAEPVELAVEDRRNARRIDLVTNSYGQGVRASPLAMATIYGSVGARRIIRPRLIYPPADVAEYKPAGEGAPLFPGLSPAQSQPWIEMVDAGLYGVANSPFGTAAGVMAAVPPELKQRIYGKTGTADTVTGMNSAWFAGWINDVAGRRRIAFACWVSHTRDTGGRACGALIARLAPRLAAVSRRS
jgi:cell division protein FtsI/penicillin-binding protein 2